MVVVFTTNNLHQLTDRFIRRCEVQRLDTTPMQSWTRCGSSWHFQSQFRADAVKRYVSGSVPEPSHWQAVDETADGNIW